MGEKIKTRLRHTCACRHRGNRGFAAPAKSTFPTEFERRGLNAHMPTLEGYRRMLPVFEPISRTLTGRDLNATEIIEILKARVHPSRRKA
jgi:hypothetical protein